MIFGICDTLLRLVFGERPAPENRAPDDEASAVVAMYFGGRDVDRGLVERLLWWEGIELPEKIARERSSASAA